MIQQPHHLQLFRQHFPDLAQTDSPLYELILREASVMQIKAGGNICLEGNQCTHLALLLEGQGRVYKMGETGREITLYRVNVGESCILTASCIISQRSFPAFASCTRDLTAIMIPANRVLDWLQDYSNWRQYLLGLVAERLDRVISIVEDVAFARMDQRIIGFLLSAAKDDSVVATHQEIADELGTSREVVSRILKDYEKRQLLRVDRGHITLLDRQALSDDTAV
ncbi:MAG: Crp/Fnr family transcriptional regulator [Chromatiales bacterium]|jgi:CRP/FNR family transcriptional regulator